MNTGNGASLGSEPARARGTSLAIRALRVFAVVAAISIVIGAISIMVAPAFAKPLTLGGHDWDEMEAQRELVVKTIKQYGQFPFWNPYACGGHSSWSSIQGGTNLISFWLPFYLLLDLPLAIRIELVGAALLGAVGVWCWASRFTRSAALRAFACVVWICNGRWALQATTGHAWHLYYAWMPWVLYFFERAWGGARAPLAWQRRDVVLGGVCWALMIYNGAIYPLPHTAFLLGIYAAIVGIRLRTLRPLLVAATSGLVGLGLAAPKLIPVADELRRYPRLVESHEVIDLNGFVQLLVARDQDLGARPAQIVQWGWHEYGMYIGWASVLVIGIATVFAKTPRERALRWAGAAAIALGFGYFHEYSPWGLLHELPIFKSQHVPSRWLYPGLLCLCIVTLSVLDRALERTRRARLALELLLLPAVGAIAYDIAMQSNRPMRHSFWMHLPPIAVEQKFHQEGKVPLELQYPVRDYAPPAMPAMLANVGVIDCTMHPGLNVWARDAAGRAPGLGARGRDDADYRGEAFTVSGKGHAEITRFSPNAVTLRVSGAAPGDLVVLNQNWNDGWSVNGKAALNYQDRIAAPIGASDQQFELRYRPRLLWPGLIVAALTIGFIWGLPQRAVRRVAGALGRRWRRKLKPA